LAINVSNLLEKSIKCSFRPFDNKIYDIHNNKNYLIPSGYPFIEKEKSQVSAINVLQEIRTIYHTKHDISVSQRHTHLTLLVKPSSK
jgi:hypothetical protein